MEFTRIPYAPNSKAMSCTNISNIACYKHKWWNECLTRNKDGTFVTECTADLEDVYPMEPGRWPRFRPATDEMLITEPFILASRMRLHTCLATSHTPVRFVLMSLSHSSSGQSSAEWTPPEVCKDTTLTCHWSQHVLGSKIVPLKTNGTTDPALTSQVLGSVTRT
jgi:hypothetical protein